MSSRPNKFNVAKRWFKITILRHNVWGKNSDVISVGNKIWKSPDGETYMGTIDNIKPAIELLPFKTYVCYVAF